MISFTLTCSSWLRRKWLKFDMLDFSFANNRSVVPNVQEIALLIYTPTIDQFISRRCHKNSSGSTCGIFLYLLYIWFPYPGWGVALQLPDGHKKSNHVPVYMLVIYLYCRYIFEYRDIL